jgi:hypothetical protein
MGAQPSGDRIRITVNPAERHQYIQGFGVNFTSPYFRDDQKPMFDTLSKDLGATYRAVSQIPALNPAMYDEFAERVVYMQRRTGIDFEYFSPFNETPSSNCQKRRCSH